MQLMREDISRLRQDNERLDAQVKFLRRVLTLSAKYMRIYAPFY